MINWEKMMIKLSFNKGLFEFKYAKFDNEIKLYIVIYKHGV